MPRMLKERFIAKPYGTRWAVFDNTMSSFPRSRILSDGSKLTIPDHFDSEADAQTEVDRVTRIYEGLAK